MPRPRKPPRLVLRLDRDGEKRFVIRDGERYRRTRCVEHQDEEAARILADYIGEKRRPDTRRSRAAEVLLADILTLYEEARTAAIARPAELAQRVVRLNSFWGEKTVSDIRGDTCRRYREERVAAGGGGIAARRELETLRTAVNLYASEHGLDVTPRFTLGENHKSRERWLTRQEAARLLWAAWRSPHHRHLARFILIGLYTGTRHRAILALQWMPNTVGGWIDVDKGVLYRRGLGQADSKKRRPPAKLPRRLLGHLRRWRAQDGEHRYVIRYADQPLARIEKAFRGARARADLGDDVTPHVLRHTRCTWLMHARVDLWEAAGSVGMTVQQFEATYGHHSPDFQKRAAEAY